jgi:hypothetical protein
MGRSGQKHALENWGADRLLIDMKEFYYEVKGSSKATAQGA